MNDVFEPTTEPPGEKALPTKWVFKIKQNPDGSIERFKVRLTVKGCAQRYGHDYNDTYSPVLLLPSLRLFLVLAIHFGATVKAADVDTAFLNAKLKEVVYIRLPKGYQNQTYSNCLKLKRCLYGLKQSSMEWYR
eukprot:Awhi_evm1s10601